MNGCDMLIKNSLFLTIGEIMEKILSYREYLLNTEEYILNKETNEIDYKSDMILQRRDYADCLFCGSKLQYVYHRHDSVAQMRYNISIKECPECGWWIANNDLKEKNIDGYNKKDYVTSNFYNGIVKKYDINDRKLPLNVLNDELKRNLLTLNKINPYKLEELVQGILSDFFSCEVKWVGGKGDKGIDLVVVESDNPILVQIKRRENPDKVEVIKGVREFIGTLYIEGKSRGIYVTTSKKYSKGCKCLKEKMLNERKLEYFDLIDFDRLIAMLHLEKKDRPWSFLEKIFYPVEKGNNL